MKNLNDAAYNQTPDYKMVDAKTIVNKNAIQVERNVNEKELNKSLLHLDDELNEQLLHKKNNDDLAGTQLV